MRQRLKFISSGGRVNFYFETKDHFLVSLKYFQDWACFSGAGEKRKKQTREPNKKSSKLISKGQNDFDLKFPGNTEAR